MSASMSPTAPQRPPKRRHHVILHAILLAIALMAAGGALAEGPGVAPWLLGGAGLLLAIPAVWGLVTGRPLGRKS